MGVLDRDRPLCAAGSAYGLRGGRARLRLPEYRACMTGTARLVPGIYRWSYPTKQSVADQLPKGEHIFMVRLTKSSFALAAGILALEPVAGSSAFAAPINTGIENAGVGVAIALPVIAGSISLYKDDWQGVAQMSLVTAATFGTALLLKHVVHEERPDDSNDQSFPSDTAAVAFAPANYLWDRYGWQYGAPAYAAAAFVGYSRVESRQHHWWDVATSAVIAWGYNRLVTSPYRRLDDVNVGIYATPNSAFVSVQYRF